ncbi:MAG: pyruvate synthase subunit beta, partial [Candidatus Hermodarchaeota archaeon]
PLYEIENAKLTFSRRGAKYRDPDKRIPVEEYLKKQGRFKKMTPSQIEVLRKDLQYEWDMLLKLE